MEPLFKNRIPRSYRKRGGDRDVSARATHLKAEMGKFLMTTIERKQMSTKTIFKRIALVAVATLGFGMLSVAPSQAAVTDETLTSSAATATTSVDDTTTVTITSTFISSLGTPSDSRTVRAVSSATGSATGAPTSFEFIPTSDSSNSVIHQPARVSATANSTESNVAVAANAFTKSGFTLLMKGWTSAGVYNVTVSSYDGVGTLFKAVVITVTVTALNTTATGLFTSNISADVATSAEVRLRFGASTDSAVVAVAGAILSPAVVATAYFTVKNSAGDTSTTSGGGGTLITNLLTATVSGPGLLTGISTSTSKSATIRANNAASFAGATESLTVWSDGTAGVGTISISLSSGVVIKTFTVTFTGAPASVGSLYFTDTIVALGTSGTTTTSVRAQIRDAGGNFLTSAGTGAVWLYSSDTSVAGNASYATGYTTIKSATNGLCVIPTSGTLWTCTLTLTDTGTATFRIGDSTSATASTWLTTAGTLTVTGNTIRTLTVAFNKATYTPGERAVITLTATDVRGVAMATGAGTLSSFIVTPTLATVTGGQNLGGTNVVANDATAFSGLLDTGVETRVVTMPTYATTVTYLVNHTTFGVVGGLTSLTATAAVADPAAAALAIAVAAAKDAADAATDAATEATDAANEATAAALLAAEAADAATVAAEEARDAADAATAAIADLATQVATFMTALKAQITTLANTIAKIAKKIKA